MDRRTFISGAGVALLVWSHAQAQQQVKRRIAIISADPIDYMMENPTSFAPFFGELQRLGYIEGENLSVQRYSSFRRKRAEIETLARAVVASLPDVILTNASAAALALVPASLNLAPVSRIVPILYSGPDPVRFGLLTNPAYPGGNISGVSTEVGPNELSRRLHLLQQAIPVARSVAYLGGCEYGRVRSRGLARGRCGIRDKRDSVRH